MAIARAPAVAGSRMLAQLDRVTAGPFPFGSRDVEIRLPSTGRVRVTLRATDADVAEDVRVGLQAVQAGDRVPAAGGFDGAPPTAMLERVPPGEYHVSIRTRIGVELVRIEHVLVVGGQTTDDPRLRNVALPHLHRFEVMVVGADGESLDDQRLHSRVGIAGRWRTSIGSGNAAMRFVSTEPALRFVVSGLGFCPQELELRPGTTRVELRRAPLLALDLPEIRAAAGTKEVGVRLLPVEVVPGVPRGGASWKLDAAGTVRPELVYSGRFRLEIAIGAQSASLGGVDVDIDRGVATWTLRDPDWREVVQRLVADAGG